MSLIESVNIEYLSECCGALPFGDMYDTQYKSGICGACRDHTMFDEVCEECEESNFNEERTICWNCNAKDYA